MMVGAGFGEQDLRDVVDVAVRAVEAAGGDEKGGVVGDRGHFDLLIPAGRAPWPFTPWAGAA